MVASSRPLGDGFYMDNHADVSPGFELSPLLDQWMGTAVGMPGAFAIEPGSSLHGQKAAKDLLISDSRPGRNRHFGGTSSRSQGLDRGRREPTSHRPIHARSGSNRDFSVGVLDAEPKNRDERGSALSPLVLARRYNDRFRSLRSDPDQVDRRLDQIRAVAEVRGLDIAAAN